MTAGDDYNRVVLAGLNEHVFDLEDYDAEAAAREAAAAIPQLSKLAWQLKRAAEASSEETGS